MEVTVEAGLSVDLATKEDIHQHHRWLQDRLAQRKADYLVLTGSAPSSGGGPLLIDLGRPPAGHLYAVQWLALMWDLAFLGGSNATISNVSAAMGIGAPRGSAANNVAFPLTDIVLPGIQIPSFVNVPDSALARAGQHIYVVVGGSGVAAGSTIGYNVNCGVLVAEDTPATRAWI